MEGRERAQVGRSGRPGAQLGAGPGLGIGRAGMGILGRLVPGDLLKPMSGFGRDDETLAYMGYGVRLLRTSSTHTHTAQYNSVSYPSLPIYLHTQQEAVRHPACCPSTSSCPILIELSDPHLRLRSSGHAGTGLEYVSYSIPWLGGWVGHGVECLLQPPVEAGWQARDSQVVSVSVFIFVLQRDRRIDRPTD